MLSAVPLPRSNSKRDGSPPEKPTVAAARTSGSTIRRVGDGSSAIASFQAALNDPSFSDLTVKVRGVSYHLHKCILAARSTVFRTMLITGGYKESKESELVMDEHPPEHFYAMLEWAYTGQASMTASSVLGVLRVADYYHFDDLVRECRELAVRFVDAENVLPLIRSAIDFEEEPIIHACLSFWATQPTSVMSRPEWSRATPETICRLLSHSEIRCSEDAVLASLLIWLRARIVFPVVKGEQDEPTSSDSDTMDDGERPGGDDMESSRSLVTRVLGSIRMGQLSTASLLDDVKPLVEHFDVLRSKYMSTLEFKLDPDRFDLTKVAWTHLQPRKGQQ